MNVTSEGSVKPSCQRVDFSSNRTEEEAKNIFEARQRDAARFYENFSGQFVERPCPICGEIKFNPIEKCFERYGVAQCKSCNSLYVNPCPTQELLHEYYRTSESSKLANEILKRRLKERKGYSLDERLRLVLNAVEKQRQLKPKVRVLEIGCNSGAFLAALKQELEKRGISSSVDLLGIDVDREAVQTPILPSLALQHAEAGTFLSKTNERFDVIVFFELIEHLVEPFVFLKAVEKALPSEGTAIFTTPNIEGLENKALFYDRYRPLAHAIFPPMHLTAFSTQNVLYFAKRCGFSLVHLSTPGKLDMEILRIARNNLSFEPLLKILDSDSDLQLCIQSMVSWLGASSHMLVGLVKPAT